MANKLKIEVWPKWQSIESLRHITEAWVFDTKDNEFGISINANTHLLDLLKLVLSDTADLIVLYENEIPVGYLGIVIMQSPLGNQLIANEHYWYVMPEHRGRGSIQLIKAANEWAKQRDCSHIILNASCLASNMHDKICGFYEKMGLKKFETSYIKEIE